MEIITDLPRLAWTEVERRAVWALARSGMGYGEIGLAGTRFSSSSSSLHGISPTSRSRWPVSKSN